MDFATILFVSAVTSGVIWGFDAWVLAPKRQQNMPPSEEGEEADPHVGESKLVEIARSIFPVLVIVFFLRSFLVEPFRIPSGSMIPTLLVGDFILVNKYAYGIRLPVIEQKVVDLGVPERGDVVVFRYPSQPNIDYIKRLVGLPGDRISYYRKQLTINGQPVPKEFSRMYPGSGGNVDGLTGSDEYVEDLFGRSHRILESRRRLGAGEGEWVVPEGHYFVMGDNRDNSHDSRMWGFVSDEFLVGKAFAIWMNWDGTNKRVGWRRIGSLIE